MMALYKLTATSRTDKNAAGDSFTYDLQPSVIKNLEDGQKMFIPFATDNTEYKEYLKWKADGGVPDAAD
jgi:hypothetical protein